MIRKNKNYMNVHAKRSNANKYIIKDNILKDYTFKLLSYMYCYRISFT